MVALQVLGDVLIPDCDFAGFVAFSDHVVPPVALWILAKVTHDRVPVRPADFLRRSTVEGALLDHPERVS